MHTKKQKNYRRALRRDERQTVLVGSAKWVLSTAEYPSDRFAVEVRRVYWKALADPHNPIVYVRRVKLVGGNDGKYQYRQGQKALYLTVREKIVHCDNRTTISFRYDPAQPWTSWSREQTGVDWRDQALAELKKELCLEGVEV